MSLKCSAVFLLFIYGIGYTSATTLEDCNSNPDCLKCGPTGCLKCISHISYPSRKCVTQCPQGFRSQWSTMADFMGRVCIYRGGFMGMSSETLTVLTGIVCGAALCIMIISFAIVYVQYKRKILEINSETSSEIDDSPERKEFVKQIEILRPYAPTFLDMLNDARRQLRESDTDGDMSAVTLYKPIIHDLAKILLLVNRPSDRIASVPDDWDHLYHWAEKNLRRLKRLSEISQPQVAQLISFLQTPVAGNGNPRTSTTMSTFKPDQLTPPLFGSSLSLQDAAVKKFDINYDTNLNPQWKFDYSLVAGNHSQFNPILWKNSKDGGLNSSYFLDDDFCQLGFRPQDEITTEL